MAVTDGLCRSFLDLWGHLDPAAASLAGPGSHDGRFGTFDDDAIRAHLAALRSIAGAIEELDVDDTGDEIDRTALLDHVRVQIFRLDKERPWRKNPALWVEHASAGLDALLSREVPAAGTSQALAERLRDLPRLFRDALDTLHAPPLLFVESALAGLEALTPLLEAAGPCLAPSSEERAALLTEAEAAVERLRLGLRSELAPDPDPAVLAVGEDEVDGRLHYEQASRHNSAELWRAALRVATDIEAEVVALAAGIDSTRPWRAVYERLSANPPDPDPATRLREALDGAARWGESRGLIASPPPPPRVTTLPRWQRLQEPIAAYLPAGEGRPGAIRLGHPDAGAIPWLAARLGVPGRHWFAARVAGLDSLVRRHIGASSTRAGWALYAAEIMREAEWEPSPESRLAERVLTLIEAHLAVLDLGIHARQLPAGDAIDHLTNRLPVDRTAAEAHVRRIATYPTEAAAALLGVREFLRLRNDVRTARGAAFDAAAFHAEVVSYGALPVPLIRWGMGLDG